MAMIADASFDFGDSTTSNSRFNDSSISSDRSIGPGAVPHTTTAFNALNPHFDIPTHTALDSDETKSTSDPPMKTKTKTDSDRADLEEENQLLKSALTALELASSRIRSERDLARMAETNLREALRAKQWGVVRQAITDEIERTREYREDLGRWKAALGTLGGHQTPTA